jgi:hypothetical protein
MAHGGRAAAPTSSLPPRRLLELARRALLLLPFFGLFEMPEPSTALLRLQLGALLGAPAAGRSLDGLLPLLGVQALAGAAAGDEHIATLSKQEWRTWRDGNAVDVELYEAARGLFEARLRAAALPVPVLPMVEPPYNVVEQLRLCRVFATSRGDGSRSTLAPWPRTFRADYETLVFMHIAKCAPPSLPPSLRFGLAPNAHPHPHPTSSKVWWDVLQQAADDARPRRRAPVPLQDITGGHGGGDLP